MSTATDTSSATTLKAKQRPGDRVFSGSHDGTVRIWDPTTGKQMRQVPAHRGTVNALALSPDGQTLASGHDDGSISLWRLPTLELVGELPGHDEAVSAITFNSASA